VVSPGGPALVPSSRELWLCLKNWDDGQSPRKYIALNTVSDQLQVIDLTVSSETPRRCPNFDVVVRRAKSNDPDSYAGGSIAIDRISRAGQVKGYDPDKK
jgi:hypothetical protein